VFEKKNCAGNAKISRRMVKSCSLPRNVSVSACGQSVVWDASNLREDGRAMIVQLARDYHAHTTVAVMATPPEELARRNRKRSHAIPQAVLARQLDRFQWPNAWEVHQVEPIV
ncbi:MAG: AAA family ATPase, partial [Verrucomicrobiales bacterium]